MSEVFESILDGLEELADIKHNQNLKKAVEQARREALEESKSWENNNILQEC